MDLLETTGLKAGMVEGPIIAHLLPDGALDRSSPLVIVG